MAKILLVDDDPDVAGELETMLKGRGHSVVTAWNGVVGLREFEKSRFDCVISDIIMPDMEGIGMMLEMRRRKPDVKIMMISGGGLIGKDTFLIAAGKLGAAATLQKPVEPKEFLRVLDECLATESRGPNP